MGLNSIICTLIKKNLNLGNRVDELFIRRVIRMIQWVSFLETLFFRVFNANFVCGFNKNKFFQFCENISKYFTGDTLFLPDVGSGRCDFPLGSAQKMWDSVQKLFSLPDDTRDFVCHGILPLYKKDPLICQICWGKSIYTRFFPKCFNLIGWWKFLNKVYILVMGRIKTVRFKPGFLPITNIYTKKLFQYFFQTIRRSEILLAFRQLENKNQKISIFDTKPKRITSKSEKREIKN